MFVDLNIKQSTRPSKGPPLQRQTRLLVYERCLVFQLNCKESNKLPLHIWKTCWQISEYSLGESSVTMYFFCQQTKSIWCFLLHFCIFCPYVTICFLFYCVLEKMQWKLSLCYLTIGVDAAQCQYWFMCVEKSVFTGTSPYHILVKLRGKLYLLVFAV